MQILRLNLFENSSRSGSLAMVPSSFIISQITNTAFYNDTYGTLFIRDREKKHVSRTDYKLAFTERNITYQYEHTIDNVTEVRITNYNQMIDLFNYPLQVGKKWQQNILKNTNNRSKKS